MHDTNSKQTKLTSKERIAIRRAAANEQVIKRNKRSRVSWGKAKIITNPDGNHEILIPQTLTPEQEQYEFPPRSKFLKRLATTERVQPEADDHPFEAYSVPPSPQSLQAPPSPLSLQEQPLSPSLLQAPPSPRLHQSAVGQSQQKPDPSALKAYFSRGFSNDAERNNPDSEHKVDAWMIDVERNSRHKRRTQPPESSNNNNNNSNSNNNKILFKSYAGKRLANITQNTTLQAPDESCKKHYVPRRLLTKRPVTVTETASRIQTIWQDYQSLPRQQVENQIGLTAMSSTGERTPIAGLVHIVNKLEESLRRQEQKSAERLQKLKSLLEEETMKRGRAEASLKQLELSISKNQLDGSSSKKVQENSSASKPVRKISLAPKEARKDSSAPKEARKDSLAPKKTRQSSLLSKVLNNNISTSKEVKKSSLSKEASNNSSPSKQVRKSSLLSKVASPAKEVKKGSSLSKDIKKKMDVSSSKKKVLTRTSMAGK
ncbi:unnamed protein product [Rhizopus stolonifer]